MRIKSMFVGGVLLFTAFLSLNAQIGKTFPSEKKVITDPVTGAELVFLTSKSGTGDSKIYQTHNQWTADGKWVIFRSDRVPGEAMAVNEETGVIMQVTEGGYTGMLNVARNSMNLYFMRNDNARKDAMQIVEVNLGKLFKDYADGKIKGKEEYERICGVTDPEIGAGGDMALDGNEKVAYFRISGKYAAKFPIQGEIAGKFGPRGMGAGPAGIAKMDLVTGKVEHVVSVPFQVGHIQGNPWHENEVVFCWETGGKAPTRMWVADGDGSNFRPAYRETEYDWVTHEAVISEDELVFAVLGHRPIALSERNMDTVNDWGPSGTKEYPTGIAVVNLRTREFKLEGQVPTNDNFWHVCGSSDGHWVAGDDFARNLWVIDRHTKEVILLSAGHKETARDHVHPTFKPDGTEIEIQSAMLSEDGKSMNICIVKMPQELLSRYDKKAADSINDNNTPLHLLASDYSAPYGVPVAQDIKRSLDKVLKCIDEGTPCGSGNSVFRITGYEWGVTYSGMLAAGEITGDRAYTDYTRSRHEYLASEYAKGTVKSLINPGALDDCGAITASMIKDLIAFPEMKDLRPVIDNCVKYIKDKEYRLNDGTLARRRPIINSVWLDDMFMGIPALALYGKLTGKKSYYDEAVRQIRLFEEKMWVPETNLFRHGWVQGMDSHPAFHWGRANGWAILTLCETLDALPQDYAGRKSVLDLYRKHVDGLCRLQGKDGFWHQLLDRSDSYEETSASAIFAYCIAHGINEGWLDAQAYGPVVCLAWNAVSTKITEEGMVEGTCVGTGMGFDPAFYYYRPVSSKAAHGYGPVLLAGAETYKFINKYHPRINDSAVQVYSRDYSSKGSIFSE